MTGTRAEFDAGVQRWMKQYDVEFRRKIELRKGTRLLGQWYGLACSFAGLIWIFTGLPDWQLVAGFMTAIDNNWLLRLFYLAFGWPVVAFFLWAILMIPVTLLGLSWVHVGRIGMAK